MKTVKQDFHDCFSYENLKNIFLEDVKLSNVMGVDNITPAVFERELEGNIKLIERKVIDGTYRFTRYKEKVISKGAKKLPRVVYIPTIRDRITLKALNCRVPDDRISQRSYPLLASRELIKQFIQERLHVHQAA
ncbi:hypothetical protein [Cobetia amphilecti]|uniref:hypothetical protein n=1 Tax=Cobetia amphilecti TaxID=1055104 RepID=UPI0034C696AA